jgi:precorrin-2 dehydrogenase/sirohydrochlorin ferrochelatase
MYPVMLDLHARKVVVAGGGKIAVRKLASLIDSGAYIQVISLTFTEQITQWAEEGRMELAQKQIEQADLNEAFFIVAATNDSNVNRQIAEWAHPWQLVNAADDKARGNVVIPAHVKRGDLSIAISTNGSSPSLTKMIKRELSEKYDESFEGFVSFLKECRELIHQGSWSKEMKLQLLKECVHSSYLEQPELRSGFLKKLQVLKG